MEKILKYFAKNKLLVNLLIIIIIITGIWSMINLRQNAYPSISAGMIIVTIKYPGAAAIDVELNAIVPIEKKLKGLKNILLYLQKTLVEFSFLLMKI